MSYYLGIHVTADAYNRALQALRFEIAVAVEYPSRQYSGDRINGMRRTLRHLEEAQRRATRERAG